MDSITIQEQRLQRSGKYKFQKKQFLKMTLMQLVVSVALFSLFLCYSSSGIPFFPHSFNVYFTLLFSFFIHTLERKYMFLLRNGILILLARTSSVHEASDQKDLEVVVEDDVEVAAEETDQLGGDDEKVMEEPVKRRGEVEVGQTEASVVVEDVNQEEEEGFGAPAAGEEVASTEELNRKIEEFISKMKEEIRIEAQQQLVEAV